MMIQYLSLVPSRKALIGLEVRGHADGHAAFEIQEAFALPWDAASTPELLAVPLSRACRERGLSTVVSIVIPRTEVYAKRLVIPAGAAGSLPEAVRQHFEAEVPFSLEDAVWDWEGQEKSTDRISVFCAAAKRDRLKLVVEACKSAGLKVREMDISTLALKRLAEQESTSRPTAVAYVGADLVECLVMQKGHITFTRGTVQATTRAEWVDELKKTLALYRQSAAGDPLAGMTVCGPEAVGIAKELEAAVGLPIRVGSRQSYLYATGGRGKKPASRDKILSLWTAWKRAAGDREDTVWTWLGRHRPVWVTALAVAAVGALVLMDRTVQDVNDQRAEYAMLSGKVAKETERPWLVLWQKIQQALPPDTLLTSVKVTEKGDVTLEVNSESFNGIMDFNNRMVRTGLLTNPQHGAIRQVMDRNRQWHRSTLKGQLRKEMR